MKIQFMIDSGASIDTVSETAWKKLSDAYYRGEANIYDVSYKTKRSVYAYASEKPLKTVATFKAW